MTTRLPTDGVLVHLIAVLITRLTYAEMLALAVELQDQFGELDISIANPILVADALGAWAHTELGKPDQGRKPDA